MNTYEQLLDYIFTNKPETIPEMDMNRLAVDPRVTWELISKYPEHLFNNFTSANVNITMPIILANSFYNWNWQFVSLNKSITWADYLANPELPWDWDCLSQNDSIGWDIISQNLDKPWNWVIVYQKSVV